MYASVIRELRALPQKEGGPFHANGASTDDGSKQQQLKNGRDLIQGQRRNRHASASLNMQWIGLIWYRAPFRHTCNSLAKDIGYILAEEKIKRPDSKQFFARENRYADDIDVTARISGRVPMFGIFLRRSWQMLARWDSAYSRGSRSIVVNTWIVTSRYFQNSSPHGEPMRKS